MTGDREGELMAVMEAAIYQVERAGLDMQAARLAGEQARREFNAARDELHAIAVERRRVRLTSEHARPDIQTIHHAKKEAGDE